MTAESDNAKQTVARICPICFDDHHEAQECTTSHLRRIVSEQHKRIHKLEAQLTQWQELAARMAVTLNRIYEHTKCRCDHPKGSDKHFMDCQREKAEWCEPVLSDYEKLREEGK